MADRRPQTHETFTVVNQNVKLIVTLYGEITDARRIAEYKSAKYRADQLTSSGIVLKSPFRKFERFLGEPY